MRLSATVGYAACIHLVDLLADRPAFVIDLLGPVDDQWTIRANGLCALGPEQLRTIENSQFELIVSVDERVVK